MTMEFRLWDKLTRSFIYSNPNNTLYITLDGQIYNIYTGKIESEYVINQYTGMVDINGTKIYDGDILSHNNINFLVSKMEAGTWHAIKLPILSRTGSSLRAYKNITVIGNVFQNQNLI